MKAVGASTNVFCSARGVTVEICSTRLTNIFRELRFGKIQCEAACPCAIPNRRRRRHQKTFDNPQLLQSLLGIAQQLLGSLTQQGQQQAPQQQQRPPQQQQQQPQQQQQQPQQQLFG